MELEIKKEEWVGEPTNSSSFTTLKFETNKDYSQTLMYGGLRKKDKYCEILFDNV